MNKAVRIIVVLLAVVTAGTVSLNAQRGMRGMRIDSTKMKKPGMEQIPVYRGVQPGMRKWSQGPGFRVPGQGMYGRGPAIWRPMPGMGNRGMDMLPGIRSGRYGRRSFEYIPDLSDKQKQEIVELRKNQQDEMEKFRSEMQEKLKQIRESHRSKIMGLLTDEQKKWLNGNIPEPEEK